jgi:hypothetical protein
MATASGRRRAVVALPPAEAPAPVQAANAADAAAEFRLAAQGYAREALEALAWLVKNAASEAVRVSAANALIDRAHGRPAQAVKVGGGDGGDESPGVSLTFQWLDPAKS